MSLKNLKSLRKFKKNLQLQMSELLQFLKTLIFPRALKSYKIRKLSLI